MTESKKIDLKHFFISEGHNFFGHHGQPAGKHSIHEVRELQCVAHRGIVGDRFFDHKDNYKGQITFFSWETFEQLRVAVHSPDAKPSAMRRNVLVSGIDLNSLVGKVFEIQGIRFEGTEECKPCYWMDQAIGPGAENFLKDNGGLRARILSDGILSVGSATCNRD